MCFIMYMKHYYANAQITLKNLNYLEVISNLSARKFAKVKIIHDIAAVIHQNTHLI